MKKDGRLNPGRPERIRLERVYTQPQGELRMFKHVLSPCLRRLWLATGLSLTLLWLLGGILTTVQAVQAQPFDLTRSLPAIQATAWYVAPPPLGSDSTVVFWAKCNRCRCFITRTGHKPNRPRSLPRTRSIPNSIGQPALNNRIELSQPHETER